MIHLGARFREIGLLASLGGSITETEVLASFRAELRKMGGVVGVMGVTVHRRSSVVLAFPAFVVHSSVVKEGRKWEAAVTVMVAHCLLR